VLIGFLGSFDENVQRMSNKHAAMLTNSAEMAAENGPIACEKRRLCTADTIDQRTRGAKRLAEMVATFEAELTKAGRAVAAAERAAIRNAALLSAISEDAAARRLAGDVTATLEDIVRLSRASAAAIRALGIKPATAATPPPSLSAWATLAAPVAQDASGASQAPPAVETHHEPLQGDGDATP
jgi:hypothetical protein